MRTKSLLAVAVGVATMSAVADSSYDGYNYDDSMPPMEPVPASSYNNEVKAKLSVGYDSRYAYKDIVAAPFLNHSGVFTFGGELETRLISDWKQQIGLEYLSFCDGELTDNNAFNVEWKALKELLPNLSFRGGYEFNYGGLPGEMSKHMGKAPHSFAQAFTAGLVYDDLGHGYFGAFDIQYGFYGMQGWRFDLNAGKRWSGVLHDRIDLELSAGTAYSCSYWGSSVNGFDQFNVKLAAPIRISGVDESRGFRISPFVQLNWGGNNRSEIRRYAGGSISADSVLRVGVEASYQF